MRLGNAGMSAVYLALLRAVVSGRSADKRLFNDPYAIAFLTPSLKLVARLARFTFLNRFISWFIEKRWPGALTSCEARTRLIDVMTINTVSDHGINQVIILGAGFDCRAHRLQMRERVQFVEADHPLRQKIKREQLDALNLPQQPVDYIPMDFHTQQPEEVMPAMFRKQHYKTLFIWEGVTNFLTAPVGDGIFRYFRAFQPGTRIIFTYVDEKVLHNPGMFFGAASVTRLLKKHHEYWNFGLDPANITGFLAAYNMELLYDAGATEYRRMYFGEKAATMKGYEYYRVAMAVVR